MVEKSINVGKLTKLVGGFLLLVLLVISFFGSWYIVNPGERGIILTLGKPSEIPSSEGFHMKIPLIQSIVKMDIKTQKYETKASAASKDLQIVSTDIAVNYHLTGESVPNLYKTIGIDYTDKVIQPAVQEVVKASTAQFTAEELITKRELVKEKIDHALNQRLLDKGILMETTSITNFDFSHEFNVAIEQKVTAEQNALTAKNKLAQIEYEAKQLIANAEGTSKSRILNAEAEAKAIQIQSQAITQQGGRNYVQLKTVEKWNGVLPQYMLSGTIPLLNIQQNASE